MKPEIEKLPDNVRWIMRRSDLVQTRIPTQIEVKQDHKEPFVITLSKRQLQVVLTIKNSPIYCASPLRLSDVVHIVKRDHGLNIETCYLTDETGPEPVTFGYYLLRDELRILEDEVAA